MDVGLLLPAAAPDLRLSGVGLLLPPAAPGLWPGAWGISSWLPPLTSFVLPGTPRISADCHIARTVCRRAERTAWAMEPLTEADRTGIRYLNRLSDYLFTLARFLVGKTASGEDRWVPQK